MWHLGLKIIGLENTFGNLEQWDQWILGSAPLSSMTRMILGWLHSINVYMCKPMSSTLHWDGWERRVLQKFTILSPSQSLLEISLKQRNKEQTKPHLHNVYFFEYLNKQLQKLSVQTKSPFLNEINLARRWVALFKSSRNILKINIYKSFQKVLNILNQEREILQSSLLLINFIASCASNNKAV